jgi:hypothetical protein
MVRTKCWKVVYMRIETAEAGLIMNISYTSEPERRDGTILQVMQSTLIINTKTPNQITLHTGNIIESESISKRRCQMDQEANLGVHRHAHALVALVAAVAPGVSLDLTLHETQLQAERYA